MSDPLSTPYPLTEEQIGSFQRDGFVKLKGVLSPEVLDEYRPAIADMVHELNTQELPLEERGTYGKAFLQITNIWVKSARGAEFVMSRRLGRIAAELLRVDGVRMYHDQALFKEPGGGFTPWHADQRYWPLSNPNTIIAWIPLQATPMEMGPLSFCVGSHRILDNRDLAISDESEAKIGRSLRDYPKDEGPFDLGEVSFHRGWTFHRAGPNRTDRMRAVMTIIYMQDGMRLAEPERDGHYREWECWLPGARLGEPIDTPLNPVIYSRRG